MTSAAAISDVDPFSDTVLADPFPAHAALRDAGPVVRLSRYGIYAVARHAEVHAVLSDWGNYCSSRGVGLDDFARTRQLFRFPPVYREDVEDFHAGLGANERRPLRRRAVGVELAIRVAAVGSRNNRSVVRGGLCNRRRCGGDCG